MLTRSAVVARLYQAVRLFRRDTAAHLTEEVRHFSTRFRALLQAVVLRPLRR